MHEKIQELLVKYNNEQCTEEEYAVVKEHLKECDECKKMLMEMRFDISYDPKDVSFEEEVKKDNQMTEYDENAGESEDVQENVSDNGVNNSSNESGLTDAHKEKADGKSKINNKLLLKSALIVAAVVVVVVIGGFGLNRYLVTKVCREFMKAYDAAFIIPEEYIRSDGTVNRVLFNTEKEEKIIELHEYCTEVEDKSIETMFAILESSLTEQIHGESELITETDEITKVKVEEMSFSTAEVTVRFGSEDDGYSYHIVCERSGFGWYIKSTELSIR